MGQVLEGDFPALGLPGAAALVELPILQVPVIEAISVLHPTGSGDEVVLGSRLASVDGHAGIHRLAM